MLQQVMSVRLSTKQVFPKCITGSSSALAGHLGVMKTHDRFLDHLWWHTLRKDVSEY